MKKHQFRAFTLVELIVVIVILSILATIAFISFGSQSSSSRDSVRLSDLANISKWLSVISVTAWNYPLPDGNISIMNWANILEYQWVAWTSILNQIKATDWFKDPLDKTYYTYWTNKSRTKYELLAFLENSNQISFDAIQSEESFATDYTNRYTYLKWDTIWIVLYKSWLLLSPLQDRWFWNTYDIITGAQTWSMIINSSNQSKDPNLTSTWLSQQAYYYIINTTAARPESGIVPTLSSDTWSTWSITYSSTWPDNLHKWYTAFDWDSNTFWASASNWYTNAWIKVSLNTAKTVNRIEWTTFVAPTYAPKNVNIQYSDDDINYTTAASWTWSNLQTVTNIIETNHSNPHKYWKFNMSNNYWWSETHVMYFQLIWY